MKEYAQVGEVNGGGKEQMVEEPEAEEKTDEEKEGGDDNQARAGKEIREEVQEGSGSPERSGSPSGGAGWSMRLARALAMGRSDSQARVAEEVHEETQERSGRPSSNVRWLRELVQELGRIYREEGEPGWCNMKEGCETSTSSTEAARSRAPMEPGYSSPGWVHPLLRDDCVWERIEDVEHQEAGYDEERSRIVEVHHFIG